MTTDNEIVLRYNKTPSARHDDRQKGNHPRNVSETRSGKTRCRIAEEEIAPPPSRSFRASFDVRVRSHPTDRPAARGSLCRDCPIQQTAPVCYEVWNLYFLNRAMVLFTVGFFRWNKRGLILHIMAFIQGG